MGFLPIRSDSFPYNGESLDEDVSVCPMNTRQAETYAAPDNR